MEAGSYSEGSKDVVVVAARHVGTLGKSSIRTMLGLNGSAVDGVVNKTALCQVEALPSMQEYYTAMNVLGITLFTVGGASVLFILLIYADTLRHIMRNVPPLVKTHSAFVLSVYPVVALATYCAIVVPRAQLLAEAVTQGVFMAALYQLFCLFVAYCGGEAELIRRVKPNSLNPRVGPCCCYPCCCLPFMTVDKKHVRYLRLLILQLPIVQGLVYMVLLVIWAEEESRNDICETFPLDARTDCMIDQVFWDVMLFWSLYEVNYMYLQPVIILSILCGVWGMNMTIKMLSEVLKDHLLQGKFVVLQLVLLLAKLQGLTARIVVWCGLIACKPPITPAVYANLIYNSAMLGEMVILGILARLFYKRELPDTGLAAVPQPQEICIISDKHYNTIEKLPKNMSSKELEQNSIQ